MKSFRRFLPVVMCIAVLGALAACSARDSTRSMTDLEDRIVREPAAESPAPAVGQVAAPKPAEEKSAAAPSEAMKARGDSIPSGTAAVSDMPALPSERMVIKTATLAVRVRDVSAAFARTTQLAETGGGYVQSSTQSAEGGERADVTIRVPPHGFLPLIASLESLGAPSSKTIAGEDVTEEYYDLDGELQNQMEVRARLFALLKQSTKVTDAIAVEEQLERVGANVNRIKGRMKYLSEMTGLSTISLTLYSDARPRTEGFIDWSGIGHGFFRAAQILVRVLFVILQVLVVAIPLVVAGGAVAWGIVLLLRWWRARRGRDRVKASGTGGRAPRS